MLVVIKRVCGRVKPLVLIRPFDYFCWDQNGSPYELMSLLKKTLFSCIFGSKPDRFSKFSVGTVSHVLVSSWVVASTTA